jgi:dGTPase
VRTCFQRDADRIQHSKSFRRLIHKTQVFLRPEGDHYRTRLTHTLEVSRIARTISRALRLNEDLAEAISVGHDLGHTPFGHAGERALDGLMSGHGGFRHYIQSLRVVDAIEKDGQGLNLTFETRDGIVSHTKSGSPATLEGKVLRLADRLAYVNHDADDAIRAGILCELDIPHGIRAALGSSSSERIDALVRDVVEHSRDLTDITYSPPVAESFAMFFKFLDERVYHNNAAKNEETKVFGILEAIFGYYSDNPDKLPPEYRAIAERDGLPRAVCDYVSGMTDSYAVYAFEKLFVPGAWTVR